MRRSLWIALVLAAVGQAGCVTVTSEKLLYEASQRVVDPSLEGVWVGPVRSTDPPRSAVLELRSGPDRSYLMTMLSEPADDDDLPCTLRIDLVHIGGSLFAFYRFDEMPELNWFPQFRLTKRDEMLQLDFIDHSGIATALKCEPPSLTYQWIPTGGTPVAVSEDGERTELFGQVVLSDNPTAVQRFLLDHEHDEAIFLHFADLTKRP